MPDPNGIKAYCGRCNGEGFILEWHGNEQFGFREVKMECPDCHGEGFFRDDPTPKSKTEDDDA